jgi:hypothetical protein
MDTELNTTEQVISALGGADLVADMFGLTGNAVDNWKRANVFPGYTFPKITSELSCRSLSADVALWNFGRKTSARRATASEAAE